MPEVVAVTQVGAEEIPVIGGEDAAALALVERGEVDMRGAQGGWANLPRFPVGRGDQEEAALRSNE